MVAGGSLYHQNSLLSRSTRNVLICFRPQNSTSQTTWDSQRHGNSDIPGALGGPSGTAAWDSLAAGVGHSNVGSALVQSTLIPGPRQRKRVSRYCETLSWTAEHRQPAAISMLGDADVVGRGSWWRVRGEFVATEHWSCLI